MEDITKIFDKMEISRLFILVDDAGIIQCVATERENLRQDKIAAGMKEYELTDEVYGEQLNEVFLGMSITRKQDTLSVGQRITHPYQRS